MKHITKLLLTILSYAPIASVAATAQAKVNELDGEIQSFKLRQITQGARFRLLPTFQISSSIEAARNRYGLITGFKGEKLEAEFVNDLKELSDLGLIEFDEKKIQAMGPSEHAIE